jgi:hypothetical protein
MKISGKTKAVMEELGEYSGGKIKNRTDMLALIELATLSGKDKLFYDLQFSAKYLNGLGRILQSNVSLASARKPGENGGPAPNADEAREKVMKEYKDNMMRFTDYLKDILLDADPETRSVFDEKYLALNRNSLVNLTTLIYDLSWLKRYYNSKRV